MHQAIGDLNSGILWEICLTAKGQAILWKLLTGYFKRIGSVYEYCCSLLETVTPPKLELLTIEMVKYLKVTQLREMVKYFCLFVFVFVFLPVPQELPPFCSLGDSTSQPSGWK